MSNKKSHGGHGLMMLLCCVAMFGAFWFFGSFQGSEGGSWNWLFLLLCPLMHVFMMKGHHGHKHDDEKENNENCH